MLRGRFRLPPMAGESAVTQAFKIASAITGKNYSPHSARHMLAALGDDLCSDEEKRKAWSQNLGHEDIVITKRHYGKVTNERRREIFGEFHETGAWTDNELQLMLQYHEHRLTRGTPKFAQAEKLVLKRLQQTYSLVEEEVG